jgi:hypothetical protein
MVAECFFPQRAAFAEKSHIHRELQFGHIWSLTVFDLLFFTLRYKNKFPVFFFVLSNQKEKIDFRTLYLVARKRKKNKFSVICLNIFSGLSVW